MSRFYMTASTPEKKTVAKKGARKELSAHIRGWNKGVLVEAFVDDDGCDTFQIWVTEGSNGNGRNFVRSVTDKKSAGPRNPKGQLK